MEGIYGRKSGERENKGKKEVRGMRGDDCNISATRVYADLIKCTQTIGGLSGRRRNTLLRRVRRAGGGRSGH